MPSSNHTSLVLAPDRKGAFKALFVVESNGSEFLPRLPVATASSISR
jgi:hypothetical protein